MPANESVFIYYFGLANNHHQNIINTMARQESSLGIFGKDSDVSSYDCSTFNPCNIRLSLPEQRNSVPPFELDIKS